jgi:hypothetical protein
VVLTSKTLIASGTELTQSLENEIQEGLTKQRSRRVTELAEFGHEPIQELTSVVDLAELGSTFTIATNVITRMTTSTVTSYESRHWVTTGEREYTIVSSQTPNRVTLSVAPSAYEGAVFREPTETRGEVRVFHSPSLKWPAKAHPVLTNQVRDILQTLWSIVVSRAIQLSFPLRETVVSVFTDPTEDESKAILRLTCEVNISQALAFWDSLEFDLQNWLNKLSDNKRTTFLTKISLRVYWR